MLYIPISRWSPSVERTNDVYSFHVPDSFYGQRRFAQEMSDGPHTGAPGIGKGDQGSEKCTSDLKGVRATAA